MVRGTDGSRESEGGSSLADPANADSHPPPRAFLVTGTDTGIGKTTVACAIAAALSLRGYRVGVVKPFETGCAVSVDGSLTPVDAARLRYFSGCEEPLDTVCPYRSADPLAPAVAFARAGHSVNLEALRRLVDGVASRHDVTLIESAGGLLVPVSGTTTFADLALAWRVPLLVVVGNRLGALNHAQLTVRHAESRGIEVAGYVVNALTAEPGLAEETNLVELKLLLGRPLGVFPFVGPHSCNDTDRRRLATAAEDAGFFSAGKLPELLRTLL